MKLRNIISSFIGCKINKLIAGGENGSIIIIETNHSDEAYFEIGCSWRLRKNNLCLCTSIDTPSKIKQQINIVYNLKISNIILRACNDLVIHFENDISIDVFCDQTNDAAIVSVYDYIAENWSIIFPKQNKCYTIDGEMEIIESSYE
ncbi:MAG: hypothetical protein RLZZ414_1252 [Bacteroidota bacterium]|jgi:hypothetical protein